MADAPERECATEDCTNSGAVHVVYAGIGNNNSPCDLQSRIDEARDAISRQPRGLQKSLAAYLGRANFEPLPHPLEAEIAALTLRAETAERALAEARRAALEEARRAALEEAAAIADRRHASAAGYELTQPDMQDMYIAGEMVSARSIAKAIRALARPTGDKG